MFQRRRARWDVSERRRLHFSLLFSTTSSNFQSNLAMRLAAASRPRVGGIGNGLRVSALARPSSPQSLSAKRAAAAPPSRAPPSWKKKSDDERHASSRGPISAAASSSSSSAAKDSSSSSSGDDDEACDVYVTPEGEVVEVSV